MSRLVKLYRFLCCALIVLAIAATVVDRGKARAQEEQRGARTLRGDGLPQGLEQLPRFAGSHRTAPLSALLRCACLHLSYRWPEDLAHPMRYPLPLVDPATPLELRGAASAFDSHRGAYDAFRRLADGEQDLLALVDRDPDSQEAQMMKGGALLEQVVALDAIVLLVHPSTQVQDVTSAQFTGLIAGKIERWAALGGAELEVAHHYHGLAWSPGDYRGFRVHESRPIWQSSPLRELGHRLGCELEDEPWHDRHGARGEHPLPAYENPGAYVITTAACLRFDPDLQRLQVCSIDGVLPDAEQVGAGTYPLVSPVRLLARRDRVDVRQWERVRDWLLSEEGRRAAGDCGYTPPPEGGR